MQAEEVGISYYDVNDVMGFLGVKHDKAYRIIRGINAELKKEGKLFSGYPEGKVPKRYFRERCGIE